MEPVITNEAGVYSFPSLAPGTYSLQAGKPGFKTAVRRQIEMHVQQAARIDVALEWEKVVESVQLMADTAFQATEDGTVDTAIENKRIVELSLNGRNYLQLVSPGAERFHRIRGAGTGIFSPRRLKYTF